MILPTLIENFLKSTEFYYEARRKSRLQPYSSPLYLIYIVILLINFFYR
jgi:hypothetical protein